MDNSSKEKVVSTDEHLEKLQDKIKVLGETAWHDRQLKWDEVEEWLAQFDNTDEIRLHFLHLLSSFMYFGANEVREMLKSLYRDIYKCPTILRIRKEQNHTRDVAQLQELYGKELEQTRFLGIGNPAESGTHLLYLFRQINSLPKSLFINGHQVYRRNSSGTTELSEDSIKRYVFLDDLAGTGSQAKAYSDDLVRTIKAFAPNAKVDYYVLFATVGAIKTIRDETLFDDVRAVFLLEESFKCFSERSRYFRDTENCPNIDRSQELCRHYDRKISRLICEKEGYPFQNYYELGFRESQLLLSFHHNTPDNAPPIFWFESKPSDPFHWKPIFNRFHKVY